MRREGTRNGPVEALGAPEGVSFQAMTDQEILKYYTDRKMSPAMAMSRPAVRRIPCKECGALAGQNCISAREGNPPRESNHMSRIYDAIRTFKFKPTPEAGMPVKQPAKASP